MQSGRVLQEEAGLPSPLGCSLKGNRVNFALVSSSSKSVTLHLFAPKAFHPFASYPIRNKTGDIWHMSLPRLEEGIEYAYEVVTKEGERISSLIDPYAKGLSTPHIWGKFDLFSPPYLPRAKVIYPISFDWEKIAPPALPLEDVILYEMHTRGFTSHPSSQVQHPGTFSGIIEKIPYLKELGVNAIELMPVFEFNECEIKRKHPLTQEPLKNVWGYSTIHFFTLMNRYAFSSSEESVIHQFRTLVKELHRAKIEIYLDVVYNHTAEGGKEGPIFSYKGLDNASYYLLNDEGEYSNFSGTGNTFNANHPTVAQLILSSLRYFVQEMHVDGFRFDLASCMSRDQKGAVVENPLIIDLIAQDPLLKGVKLIAEAWDAAGLYQVGHFPGKGRFSDWNGVYRDTVRKFIKGTDGQAGAFAKAITGSPSLYKCPTASINFITCHDGFTLEDLVSYNEKHNENNGENNLDGNSDNQSWNCGAEGKTTDPEITQLRLRQKKNFHVALMLSLGVPMILMGDELGHSKQGNNNTYCQDDETNCLIWENKEREKDWYNFYRKMIQFRKKNSLLKKTTFLNEQEILWHGEKPLKANWGSESKLIAFTRIDPKGEGSLFVAFNAYNHPVSLTLPHPPAHTRWYRLVDTFQPSPLDYIDNPTQFPPCKEEYSLSPYSSCILIAHTQIS